MGKLTVLGVALTYFVTAANALETDYDITGTLVSQENTCTQVTITFSPLRDCSYGDTRALQTGIGFQMPSDWLGPVGGSVYYAPTAPQADPAILPISGADTRINVPVTGTFTIDDMGAPNDPTVHVISATFDIGEMIRSVTTGQATRAVEGWTAMTHTMSPTQVSATSAANGNGGFDYIIAQGGILPTLICKTGVAPDFNSGDCFPTNADLPPTPPFTPWWETPTPSPGVGIARGAAFAPNQDMVNLGPPFPPGPAFSAALTTATFTGYNCVDTGGGDCPTNMALIGQGDPNNGSTLLWGAAEDAGFDNFILSLKTDATGAITEAQAYWTQEHFIGFSPFTSPQDTQPDNSWAGGRISFTGQAPFSFGANDDVAATSKDVPTTINPLDNDIGFIDPVTVTISQQPGNGTAIVNGSPGNQADISITYTPSAGFVGEDTFEYTVDDGANIDTATVTVSVAVPQANPDAVETSPNSPVLIDVLANDNGLSGTLTVDVIAGPGFGTAEVIGSPGSAGTVRIRYTPATGFSGNDSFDYQVSDGVNTASATVSISVLAFAARDDEFTVLNTRSTQLFVVRNDVGFSDPVTVTLTGFPSIGSAFVSNSSNQEFTYIFYSAVSNQGDYTTTMNYQITDGTNTDSATVTVNAVAFAALDDEAITGQGEAITINVAENDLGFSSPRTVGIFTNPHHGTVVVNGSGGFNPSITYTPNPGFIGTDTFEYAIDDGTRIDIAQVTVHVIIDADDDLVDDGVDNCLGAANTEQIDADADGYGNWCDADFNNDGIVNFGDLAIFRANFASNDPVTDLDGNGIVNFGDLARFKALFAKPPGPSAIDP